MKVRCNRARLSQEGGLKLFVDNQSDFLYSNTMITTVYALTRIVKGPAGHGEPGEPYLSLLTDGSWFTLGNPHPLFTTQEAAHEYMKSNKLLATVTPLELRS